MAQWFRAYSETVDDLKIERAAHETNLPKVVILGTWFGLMALAGKSPLRGCLMLTTDMPLAVEEIAVKIGIEIDQLRSILKVFETLHMVIWDNGMLALMNWDKRQFTSDNSVDRVRQWRNGQAQNEDREEETPNSGNDETLQKRFCNVSETPSESETESETESEKAATAASPLAKKQPPTEKPDSSVLPDTPEARKMFAKLQANARANHRRGPQKFPTQESKRQFLAAVRALGGRFDEALGKALEVGCTSVPRIVAYISSPKWQEPKRSAQPPEPPGPRFTKVVLET